MQKYLPSIATISKRSAAANSNIDLPADSDKPPYWVWPEQENKLAKQLRIYFLPTLPQPPLIQEFNSRYGE